MKAKRWIPITLFTILAASACATGVGAGDPAGGDATATPSSQNIATSVPATPRTSSPTAVPTRVATEVARPRATSTPVRNGAPVATATPRGATPGPTAVASPGQTPTASSQPATATPEPTAVIAGAPGDVYEPTLNYSYTLPDGWTETVVDESIVLKDSTGKIKVTITERYIDRWRYQAINVLGVSDFPQRPAGWDTWYSSSVGLIKGNEVYEYQFTGTKKNVSYNNFVHWYLWGDMNIEVDAEILSSEWGVVSDARFELQRVLDSFKPHDGSSIMGLDAVLEILAGRLDDRPAGVFVRDEAVRGRVELTCRELFEDLMSEPVYLGKGTWQATAFTVDGAETWWVYEPSGTIVSVDSNHSRC